MASRKQLVTAETGSDSDNKIGELGHLKPMHENVSALFPKLSTAFSISILPDSAERLYVFSELQANLERIAMSFEKSLAPIKAIGSRQNSSFNMTGSSTIFQRLQFSQYFKNTGLLSLMSMEPDAADELRTLRAEVARLSDENLALREVVRGND